MLKNNMHIINKNTLNYFAVYLMLSSLFFRGALEEALSKQIAYIIQLFVVIAVLLYWIIKYKLVFSKEDLLLLAGFVIFSSISTIYTLFDQDFFGGAYLSVNILYILIALIFFRLSRKISMSIDITMGISVFGMILLAFGIMQQFLHIFYFPGMSEISLAIRPSSLTGSYLHYPIILSIIGLLSLDNKSKFIRFMGVVMIFGVFLTYSRSGMFIVVVSILINGILMIRHRNKHSKLIIACLFAIILAIGVSRVNTVSPYIDRIISSGNLEESSNNTRLNYWGDGIKMILDSPLVIGNKTGMVTNLSKNFNLFSSSIVESSILQQFINFGLIGALLFYAVMFKGYTMSRQNSFVSSIAMACLLQTSFYQTFEVFPFVILFSLLPYFAHIREAQNEKSSRYKF